MDSYGSGLYMCVCLSGTDTVSGPLPAVPSLTRTIQTDVDKIWAHLTTVKNVIMRIQKFQYFAF